MGKHNSGAKTAANPRKSTGGKATRMILPPIDDLSNRPEPGSYPLDLDSIPSLHSQTWGEDLPAPTSKASGGSSEKE